jgi:hypothetical protein
MHLYACVFLRNKRSYWSMIDPERQENQDSAIAQTEANIVLPKNPTYRVVEKNRRFIIEETSFDAKGNPAVLEQGPIARQLADYLEHITLIREEYSGIDFIWVLCSYRKPPDVPVYDNSIAVRPENSIQRGIWKKFNSHEKKERREIRKKRNKQRKAFKYAMTHGSTHPAESFFFTPQTESHPIIAGTTWVYDSLRKESQHLTHDQKIQEALNAVKKHAETYPSIDPHNTHALRILIYNKEVRRGNPIPSTKPDNQNSTIIYDYYAPMVNGEPNTSDVIFEAKDEELVTWKEEHGLLPTR